MTQPLWFNEMLRCLTPDQLEEWDERAGIITFDAGYDKGHAECLALLLIARKYKLTFELKEVSYLKGDNTHE